MLMLLLALGKATLTIAAVYLVGRRVARPMFAARS